jgi:hypothetical protein
MSSSAVVQQGTLKPYLASRQMDAEKGQDEYQNMSLRIVYIWGPINDVADLIKAQQVRYRRGKP